MYSVRQTQNIHNTIEKTKRWRQRQKRMMCVSLNSYNPAGTIRCAQCQILSLLMCMSFSLSLFCLFLTTYRFSSSLCLSMVPWFACKSLLCFSDVSILFLSSTLAFMNEKKKRRRRRRERKKTKRRRRRCALACAGGNKKSITNNETIAVLHTKLACRFIDVILELQC